MRLRIITATAELLNIDNIDQVNLPGSEGELGILPGHISLITPLDIGQIEYKHEGTVKHIAVNGGFVRVFNDEVFVMANEALVAEELVLAEINDSIKRAEEKIAGDIEPAELVQLEKQLRYERIKKIAAESLGQ